MTASAAAALWRFRHRDGTKCSAHADVPPDPGQKVGEIFGKDLVCPHGSGGFWQLEATALGWDVTPWPEIAP